MSIYEFLKIGVYLMGWQVIFFVLHAILKRVNILLKIKTVQKLIKAHQKNMSNQDDSTILDMLNQELLNMKKSVWRIR